ncbi:MAG: hypothetical protein L6R40_002761 [Gallowayella cf. fulva]|nr:MAG: hypothetical protein L6R40_002761 [Xanthomendoza cf. fulva]
MIRSHNQLLLRCSQYKPLPFLTPALYSNLTESSKHPDLHEAKDSAAIELALNPPASTLPPPLLLPTPATELTGKERLKFYYRTGRAYLTFYKSGLKAMDQNWKLLRQMRPRIPSGQSSEQALRNGLLSRAEYHFARRTSSDVSRFPLFLLVLVICGEFTPLVVVFMGLNGAVPRVCHIPRQINGAREKLEARRRESFREGTVTGKQMGKSEDAQTLPRPVMLHIGRSLGLYSSLWDKVGVTPTVLLPRRIQKATDRIDVDDLAIQRGGGVRHLNDEELKLAAEERGLDVVGRPAEELKSVLLRWMDARKRATIVDLLCRRPSAWPGM